MRACGCPSPADDPVLAELLEAADRTAESLVRGAITRGLADARGAEHRRVFSAEQSTDP